MARALARPRARRSRVPERERELKRLCLSVCDDTGFRLYVATYDQPKRRDELIAQLGSRAKAQKVRVTRLDIVEAAPETSLVGLLRAHLQRASLPAGWRQAVMVTGIEERLDYSSGRKGVAFLHQANLLRDALPEAAPGPIVLWLSRLASAAMQTEAPDLWDWRAASFDFAGDEAPRVEALREMTALRPEDDLRLSGERRQARVRMLDDLLKELERVGPAKSKRELAERANLLLELGIEESRLGRAAEAVARFQRALGLYREIGDRPGEGAALGNLGNAYGLLGEPRRAIEYYEQDLAIAREISDQRGEGAALGNLGNAHHLLGEPRRAIEHYEQDLAIARTRGDRLGEGGALGNLGNVHADLGEPQRAIEYYKQQLAIARAIGDRLGEGGALGNLGTVYAELGDQRRAIQHHEQHLAIASDIGDRWGEGNALGNLANAYAALGEPQRAIEHYERRLANAREIGNRRGEGNALLNFALTLNGLGERGGAIRRMREALRICEQIEDPLRERARAMLEKWRTEDTDGEPGDPGDSAVNSEVARALESGKKRA